MPYSSLVARDVVLLCFPPVDVVFAEFARRATESLARPHAEAVEAELRKVYPAAVVRERDVLASFGRPAWYIYRDGRYSPFVADPWWEAPDAAWILLGDDGRYLDASPSALALLHVDRERLLAAPSGSFTVPSYQAAVPWIIQLVQDTGQLHSTALLRPAGGAPDIPVEYRLVKDGDGAGRHVATIRPVPAEAVEIAPIGGLRLEAEGA
jgi:PAS domain-containing protein